MVDRMVDRMVTKSKPGYLPGLTPAEALAADLAKIALADEVDVYEQKARASIKGEVEEFCPWFPQFSAKELLPIINRLRQAEDHKCGGNY